MPSGLGRSSTSAPERPHRLDLLLREGVRADDPQRVALDRADEGERAPGRPAGVLDDRWPGLEPAGALGALDHGQRHPVLVRAGRVDGLELDPDLGHAGFDEAVEPDDRCAADRAKAAGRRITAPAYAVVRWGTPTKRRPSSSYWPGSGIDGASSIGSLPDCVLGNAITSRMFVWLASSAAQRSMPRAMPPCGGAPYSKASRTAPNFSCSPRASGPGAGTSARGGRGG